MSQRLVKNTRQRRIDMAVLPSGRCKSYLQLDTCFNKKSADRLLIDFLKILFTRYFCQRAKGMKYF